MYNICHFPDEEFQKVQLIFKWKFELKQGTIWINIFCYRKNHMIVECYVIIKWLKWNV